MEPLEFQPQRNDSLGTTDSKEQTPPCGTEEISGEDIERRGGLISIPIARDLSRNVLSLAAGPPLRGHVPRIWMRITAHTRITP